MQLDTSNFKLKNIPIEVMVALQNEAKRLHISINALILQILENNLDTSRRNFIHHDLDYLAGSWSAEEEKVFKKNAKFFEEIEEKHNKTIFILG